MNGNYHIQLSNFFWHSPFICFMKLKAYYVLASYYALVCLLAGSLKIVLFFFIEYCFTSDYNSFLLLRLNISGSSASFIFFTLDYSAFFLLISGNSGASTFCIYFTLDYSTLLLLITNIPGYSTFSIFFWGSSIVLFIFINGPFCLFALMIFIDFLAYSILDLKAD